MFQIPDWLRSWLIGLNWDIFDWHVYLGDALISLISWVIDGLNLVYEWTQTGLAYAQGAYQIAQDLFLAAQNDLSFWTKYLYELITAWPGQLSEWWSGTAQTVADWIDASVQTALAGLQGFLSLGWFSAWWGNTTTSFADWWTATRTDVLNAVDTVVAPVRNQVNQHAAVIDLLTNPGDTALRWLWDRITTAIVRLW